MKKNEGSYTVEAVIVMSSILIIITAILFGFMLMYQNVVIMNAASYGAQQGAVAWVNSGIALETGEGYNNDGLYYRFAEFNNSNLVQIKKQKIENAVREKLKLSIFSNSNIDVKVDFKNNIIQRIIIVEVSQEIPIPFGAIAKLFNDGNKPFEIKARISSAVAEPAEYIRNIDFVKDMAKKIKDEIEDKIEKKLEPQTNQIKDHIRRGFLEIVK